MKRDSQVNNQCFWTTYIVGTALKPFSTFLTHFFQEGCCPLITLPFSTLSFMNLILSFTTTFSSCSLGEKMHLFSPYVSVLFWVHCFTPMVLSINLVDEFALIALKTHITYDSQGILATNWSTKSSYCNWYGISCNAPQQRVSAINLSNMDLEGTIAPQVGNLSFLVSLDLSNNYFHDSLPKDIGKISITFVYFMKILMFLASIFNINKDNSCLVPKNLRKNASKKNVKRKSEKK